jgi:HSP20 family protein
MPLLLPFPFTAFSSSLGQDDVQENALLRETRAIEDRTPAPAPPVSGAGRSQGQVAVDIFEQDGYVIIKVPIAGVRLSDLDIEITDNVITIRGARHQGDSVPADQYYLQECYWGDFSRSITLPFTIDAKKVRATFNKECILKILIPREDKVKIVRISEG